jgi:D-sedoheptulose 7-phosphate isomerase
MPGEYFMDPKKQISTWEQQIEQALMSDATSKIKYWIRESVKAKESLWSDPWKQRQLVKIAQKIASVLDNGKKVLSCGNGGSAGDSGHFVGEFVNQFCMGRTKALAAVDLSAMNSTITAIGNDWGYEFIFSKQVEGLGKPGDLLVAISTSGSSPNILQAIHTAKRIGLTTVLLTGKFKKKYVLCPSTETEIEVVPDYLLTVDSDHTPLIQENHIMMLHILVYLVDYLMRGVDYFDKRTWK